jgi:leucyl aminopeptidase (aminopeptidase T)
MYDEPHGDVTDNQNWQDRRAMAEEWRDRLAEMAHRWDIKVNPIVIYKATGGNNADLPEECEMGEQKAKFEDVIKSSTIVLAMPEFSATAPLYGYSKASDKLRVGSMPGVARFMQESGLSADYAAIAEKAKMLGEVFDKAIAAEVEFSTGHKCYFDLPPENHAHMDDGILHPDKAGTDASLSNLPAGEVYCVPNENDDSKTEGELPVKLDNEVAVYVVKNNRIVDVKGESKEAAEMRENFKADPAWQNIAEFAVGLNDKAKVTGIILEDEKAGFHWAYGRSDHFGGKVGVKDFTSPQNVVHMDVVYAKESPITCAKLDMIFPDNTRKTLIVNGDLQV